MASKTHTVAYSLRNVAAVLIGVAFAAALAGCAGAGTKTGEYIDDSAVTTKVKAQLVKAENLPAADIHVKTENGTVKLSGFVKSETQKQRAEIIAREVSGVRSVDNGLVVRTD